MQTDYQWLKQTNIDIGDAETEGNKEFFKELLAEAFAFRRANGAVVGRQAFIDGVNLSQRRPTDIVSISFLRENRALVTCIVTMEVNGERKSYDNVRLFIRDASGAWKLLSWANEPM